MLESEIVNLDNLEMAIKIQNTIFPNEDGSYNIIKSAKNISKKISKNKFRNINKYFIVKDGNDYIGIWGIYTEKDKNEAWLGWFGVLPEFRKKGYGRKILEIFENYCIENNFDVIRLYTDEIENDKACILYEKFGMTKEYYRNKKDITAVVGNILIYSKSLNKTPLKLWNNKFINLKLQMKIQENGGVDL